MHNEMDEEILKAEETRYLLSSPGFVAVLSALVMGLGQVFNGQARKALIFFLAEIGLALYLFDFLGHRIVADTIVSLFGPSAYYVFLGILVIGGLSVWIFNIVDAYRVAQFLSFIYDRSIPQMADVSDDAFYGPQVGGTGFRFRQGISRKALFMTVGIALYSAILVVLGTKFVARNEELNLSAAIQNNPQNAAAHLKLGEISITNGRLDRSIASFEEVLRIAQDTGEPRLAYHAYTDLARVYAMKNDTSKANQMLKNALALFPSTSQEAIRDVEELAPSSRAQSLPVASTDDSVKAVTVVEEGQESKKGRISPSATKAGETTLETTSEEAPPSSGSTNRGTLRAERESRGTTEQVMKMAKTAFSLKNYGEARRYLDTLERRGIKTAEFFQLTGQLHAEMGQWGQGVLYLEKASELGAIDPETRLQLATGYLNLGQKEKSRENLEIYLKLRTTDNRAVAMLVDLLVEKGELPAAKKYIDEALIEKPHDTVLLSRAFDISLAQKNEEQAFQTASIIIRDDRKPVQAVKDCVRRAIESGDLELGSRISSYYLERYPTDATGYVLKGTVLARRDDLSRALGYFEKARSLDCEDPELSYQTGLVYQKEGKISKALQNYKDALSKNPEEIRVLRQVAEIQARNGDLDDARQAYEKVLGIDQSDDSSRIGLARILLRLGQFGPARKQVETVLKRVPSHPEASRLLKGLLENHGEDLKNDTQEAKDVNPVDSSGSTTERRLPDETRENSGPGENENQKTRRQASPPAGVESEDNGRGGAALLEQAREAYSRKRYEEAASLYREVIQQTPVKADSHHQLARCLKALGKDKEAVLELEKARKLSPDDANILLEIGQEYTAMNRPQEAANALEALMELDSKNLAGHYALGVNYEKLRRFDKAEEQYRLIIHSYPRFVEAHDYLGNLYFSQGRYSLASREYREVLNSNPQDPKARFKYGVSLYNEKDLEGALAEFKYLKDTVDQNHELHPKLMAYLSKLDVAESRRR